MPGDFPYKHHSHGLDKRSRGERGQIEKQYFVFQVCAVDPGCTLEIEIEDRVGNKARITTTDDPSSDREAIKSALNKFIDEMFIRYSI